MRKKFRKNILTDRKSSYKILCMTPKQVCLMAEKLMVKYGLTDWQFGFTRSKKIFGTCHYAFKRIDLSIPMCMVNTKEEILDTILHEIAHVLAFQEDETVDHGPTWKKICNQIGARPIQYFTEEQVIMPQHKYQLVHSNTGYIYNQYYRKPKWANRMSRVSIENDVKNTIGKLILKQLY